MIEYFGIPVLQSDGTLNPALAGLCEVTSVEQRYMEPVRFEITMKEPTRMDKFTNKLFDAYQNLTKSVPKKTHRERDVVDRVVHNPPATIVFWKDKTKTVVKQQDGDAYDPEKGFMAACTKKLFGNDNQFNYEIKWYVPKQKSAEPKLVAEEPSKDKKSTTSDDVLKAFEDELKEKEAEVDEGIKAFANILFAAPHTGPKC